MNISKSLKQNDFDLFKLIERESQRQEEEIELIASENYASAAVLEALGSPLNNKYSEGYPGKRYYGGNHIIDEVELLAIERLKDLFQAEHANVQPLSGSSANLALYLAFLNPGDKVLGLKLDHGGHLSHGHQVNFSGKLYNFISYGLDSSGLIDMNQLREMAVKERPKMIVAGFSAYSRDLNWKAFKEIADEVGAYTLADISHIAGLIAAGVLDSPVPYFDLISSTTHKTLRGPRGAFILSKKEQAQKVDRAVFPGLQGGPHDHVMAAKAVAFKEALDPSFKDYCRQVIKNSQTMAQEFLNRNYEIVSGGTSNHLMILDLRSKGLSGLEAEKVLETIGISVSRSTVPNDTRPPNDPSGIRLGSPAISTRGFREAEVSLLVQLMDLAFKNKDKKEYLKKLSFEVQALAKKFPIYK